MNENIHFTPYFASPIYTASLPELVKDLNKASNKFIKESKNAAKKTIEKNQKFYKKKIGDFGLSFHSLSLINEPEFNQLKMYVERRSTEILDHMGYDLSNYQLKWTEFWVQEFAKNGGGHHDGHVHYDNHISGFYFLKCSEKTSVPIFHDPRPGKMMTMLPLKNANELSIGSPMVTFKPKPGDVMLFPSFLQHQFSVDPGVEPFRFIHFNVQAIRKTP